MLNTNVIAALQKLVGTNPEQWIVEGNLNLVWSRDTELYFCIVSGPNGIQIGEAYESDGGLRLAAANALMSIPSKDPIVFVPKIKEYVYFFQLKFALGEQDDVGYQSFLHHFSTVETASITYKNFKFWEKTPTT